MPPTMVFEADDDAAAAAAGGADLIENHFKILSINLYFYTHSTLSRLRERKR